MASYLAYRGLGYRNRDNKTIEETRGRRILFLNFCFV